MAHTFDFDNIPAVKTTSGYVKGFFADGCHIFRGIPYAQAKRFQAPEPMKPWEGIREATSYGFVCPLLTQDTPTKELLVPHRYWPQNENCLNLNIWTGSLSPVAKRPVVVWIHGGAFSAGSSIEQIAYDGAALCKFGDVVVVSVNHRLNILGYLDLSPFGEKYKNSGNNGQADLVAALRWIQDNIVSFGGDPDNVTLWGQSGGGMKISALMQTPAADGLFHKAVIMSGVAGDLLSPARGDGRAIVTAMLDELGLKESQVETLETIPYSELAQVYNKVSRKVSLDGNYVGCIPLINEFYLGEGTDVGFTAHAQTIPTMVGTVFGEFAFGPLHFDKAAVTEAQIQSMITQRYGRHTDEILGLFHKAYPGRTDLDLVTLDMIFRPPTKAFIKEKAKGMAPVYAYDFIFDFPYAHGKPAWHCADIPFFFHNIDLVDVCCVPGVSHKLEYQTAKALTQFIHTGDPNHSELPYWPASTPEVEQTMIFDRTCRVGANFDNELLDLNTKLSPKMKLSEILSWDVQH